MMIRLRAFGPAMSPPKTLNALLAALGVTLGLLVCDMMLLALTGGLTLTPDTAFGHLLLIAPFGATAFLIFVVPNSPLAQPWSAVIGNTVAALAALAVLAVTTQPVLAAPLAVGLAVFGMALCRAYHPPGGAVALATVVAAGGADFPGLSFAVAPVCIGTLGLVAAGVIWNRLTGRTYPFRQPAPPAHATRDTPPEQRLRLGTKDLAILLDRLRMSPNIGVGDLARLIDAAETEAVAHHLGDLTAADIMSRDIISASPATTVADLAALFRKHRFKTLPLTDAKGRHLGLIDQSALLGLVDPTLTAKDLAADAPTLPPTAGISALMDHLADGHQQAVPITAAGQLVGLVTRSDLIALLSARLRDG